LRAAFPAEKSDFPAQDVWAEQGVFLPHKAALIFLQYWSAECKVNNGRPSCFGLRKKLLTTITKPINKLIY
jgi:hypothetical protein